VQYIYLGIAFAAGYIIATLVHNARNPKQAERVDAWFNRTMRLLVDHSEKYFIQPSDTASHPCTRAEWIEDRAATCGWSKSYAEYAFGCLLRTGYLVEFKPTLPVPAQSSSNRA
jgi:hypothetical protein